MAQLLIDTRYGLRERRRVTRYTMAPYIAMPPFMAAYAAAIWLPASAPCCY